MKRIAYFLLIAVVLVGCKSSKRLTATKVPEVAASEAAIPSYLASRLQRRFRVKAEVCRWAVP